MEYKEAEEHLAHADGREGVAQVKADFSAHFIRGGTQTEGDESVVKHSAQSHHSAKTAGHPSSQLQDELDSMTQRHGNDNIFTRGVAGLEHAYAEEDADAE